MLLYISCGDINPSALDILLKDGCEPTICGYQHPNGSFESAIWFKVMIIDSITIDCNRQQLSWVPLSGQDSGIAANNADDLSTERQSQYSLTSCLDECIESNIETIFTSVAELAILYQSGRKTREEWFESIIQLLHIHVLPNIHLTPGYVKYIEQFLQCQEVYIKRIDEELIKKTDQRNLSKQAQVTLRTQFLNELMKPTRHQLPKPIVARLLSDLSKDIGLKAISDSLRRPISELQLAVSRLREMHNTTILRRFKDALMSVPMEPIHNMYIGLCEEVDLCSSSVKGLTDKKLLILSVKEAARSALYDLKSGEQTFGPELDSISSIPSTNVLGESKVTNLLSIAEQVSALLASKSNSLAVAYQVFCRSIVAQCETAKRERALFDEVSKSCGKEDKSSSSNLYECIGNLDITLGSADSSMSSPDSDMSFRSSNCSGVSYARTCKDELICDSRSLPLPASEPLTQNGNNSVRSVSAYQPASEDHNKRVMAKSKKKQKASEATFVSHLPGLMSLSEDNAYIDSPVIVFDIDKITRVAETVKAQVMDHMKSMCEEFQKHFRVNYADMSVKRQIWVSYECHLYSQLMMPLTELYQLQYCKVTEALNESLECLSSTDLDLDDALLAHLLHDGTSSAPASPATSLVSSLVSNQDIAMSISVESANVEEGERRSSTASEDGMIVDGTDECYDDINTLRRCFSMYQHQQSRRLPTVRKSVQVNVFQRPTVIIYERKVNPVVTEPSAVISVNDCMRNPVPSGRTMKMKPRYVSMFDSALKCIDAAVMARTPASKLRHLAQCLRETSRLISKFYSDCVGRSHTESGCDELMDAVVILLCNIDTSKFLILYCQLKLLADVMPDWLQCGPHCFSLMQFIGACQFIQDRLTRKRNRFVGPSLQTESYA